MTMKALAHDRIVTMIAMITSGVSTDVAGAGTARSVEGTGVVTLSQ
jgi:hypothetical protein